MALGLGREWEPMRRSVTLGKRKDGAGRACQFCAGLVCLPSDGSVWIDSLDGSRETAFQGFDTISGFEGSSRRGWERSALFNVVEELLEPGGFARFSRARDDVASEGSRRARVLCSALDSGACRMQSRITATKVFPL